MVTHTSEGGAATAASAPPRRRLPPFYALIALIAMAALQTLAPGAQLLAFPWNLLGLAPLGLGTGVMAAAARAFERAGTTIKPYQVSSALLTGGPYRFTRNPMYLGGTVALAGVAMLLGGLTPFLVVAALLVLIDRRFVRMEERMLEQTFGEAYRSYRARVRRWV